MKLHANARLSVKGRGLLIDRVLTQGWSLTQAAEAAGVSDRTTFKWVARFRAEGEQGLLDRSSAPRHRPTRTPQPTIDRIIDLRKRHRWSARTIASHLTDEGTPVSTATVTRHLKANGLNRLRHLDPSQANRTANPDQARSPPTPDVPI